MTLEQYENTIEDIKQINPEKYITLSAIFFNSKIIAKIKGKREDLVLSQKQLAKIVKIRTFKLAKIENCTIFGDIVTIYELCKILNIKVKF